MTPQARIARHQETIRRIEDMGWLTASGFSLRAGGSVQPEWDTRGIVEQLGRLIAMHDHVIEALEEQN